ncbi:Dolichyl-diphosphooligosaccharide--protein glycosyltransferase subunit WBP1 [Pyronema domesticum]|uniref:Dolichyl-diphosphooligosaccharide--protein glycosyltransferase subunit WBP1 n=1 Tax=Pyronema omphalodes (strain CBS 100304) TaxID=1076935 RepID=U4LNW3_PYROM|nr:Dolichyl-diphosphooligosaccharide--protein glycosyltransferase subunit WBP1 [Pyronema domesticum]CCX33821.1 Similar to Dolichyl-diphosphooligosaccharide--protein glycosyltransferase 48 kDa subunit; acc. no. O59866 [Pyronema omphalodes CBS 100304]
MALHSLIFSLLWICVSVASAASLTGSRLLVVLEDSDLKATYSQFLGDLEARGYDLSIQSPKDEKLSLFEHGERAYDHVILFPPKSKGYGPSLTPQKLVDFTNKEGNVLVLTSPSGITEQARELARELEIDLPPRDFLAVDHFNYNTLSESEKHDVILIPRPAKADNSQNYFSGKEGEMIAFRGAGHMLGNRPLIFPVLSGSRTAYTYDTKEDFSYAEDPWVAGSQMHYVTALQARNNARITVSGSTDMFSDEFFAMEVQAPGSEKKIKTANREFAKEISGWTFQEIGVVKVAEVRHYLANTTEQVNPIVYRVKNDITYEISLSTWSNDRWVPFSIPSGDALQLEFTMLDPYYRLSLAPSTTTAESQVYTATFRAPDQHGIFSFRVNYKRPFVTYVDEKWTVPLRHFAHDEYTRSWDISGAWVWIAGIAVTVAGWMVFCGLWLYSAPPKKVEVSKKKN